MKKNDGLGCIYIHTSLDTGKRYVGQTIGCPDERWLEHQSDAKNGSERAFHQAIRKYGADRFISRVVEDGIPKGNQLDEREKYYIALWNTIAPNGYNMTSGGASGSRWWEFLTEEEKQIFRDQMSQISRSWWDSRTEEEMEAFGEMMSHLHRNRIESMSEDEIRDLSESKSLNTRKWWESLTIEERDIICELQSKITKNRWESMTEEERTEHRNKIRDGWNNKSEEEMKAFGELRSQIARSQWSSMTEEERIEHGRKISSGIFNKKLEKEIQSGQTFIPGIDLNSNGDK